MEKTKLNDLRVRAKKMYKDAHPKKNIPKQDMSKLIRELNLYQIELEIQNDDLIKTQVELEKSRAKYIELYDLAPVGYFAFDDNGLIQEVNQAGCQLLGLEKRALINRCFSRYIVPEHQIVFSQYRRQAFTDKNLHSYELKLMRWNQPSFHALLECKMVENEHTGCQQLLTFVTDITARKTAEDTLHQQRIKMASIDRLRSINELVYGISQQQTNALMMMDNYLQGCIRRLESNNYQVDELLQVLKKAANQSRTIADVIQSRKISTSKSVFHFVETNINPVIKQTISLLTHETVGFPVTIQYSESYNSAKLKLDIFHIQQAILNLARNAIEAMRDSRTKEPKLLIEISDPNKDMMEVTLQDNGPGFSQEDHPKLFDPHFTTKSYGIGLGLTVSRVIIEKHGGQLFAAANPFGGACFGFTLPCTSN